MAERVTVPVGSLVEDFSIYPRNEVNAFYVGELVEALRAGVELPPPLVEKGTLRILDGWHRVRAYKRVYGPEAPIEVELFEPKKPLDALLVAIRLNVQHGKRLDTDDLVRCSVLLQEAGLDTAQIAAVLQVTPQRVQVLVNRVAIEEGTRQVVVLKSSVSHLSGETLRRQQVTVIRHLHGDRFAWQVRRLREAIEADLLPREDETLVRELEQLAQAISTWLQAVVKQPA